MNLSYVPRYMVQYESQVQIRIDVGIRQLTFITHERYEERFPVAVGKLSTPTPTGHFNVIAKVVNPSWRVLGTRWMGLNIPGGNYGIHGTNAPWSIGRYISNGCIRMYNKDIESIFPRVPIGTPVVIEGKYPGSSQWGTLRRGSRGPEVVALQQKLRQLGYYTGAIDGIFGPLTESAVLRFQRDQGIHPTGVVDLQTRSALGL
ncbi:MAG: L,D-transpeptidase family protein [Bacillota bacterium]